MVLDPLVTPIAAKIALHPLEEVSQDDPAHGVRYHDVLAARLFLGDLHGGLEAREVGIACEEHDKQAGRRGSIQAMSVEANKTDKKTKTYLALNRHSDVRFSSAVKLRRQS